MCWDRDLVLGEGPCVGIGTLCWDRDLVLG